MIRGHMPAVCYLCCTVLLFCVCPGRSFSYGLFPSLARACAVFSPADIIVPRKDGSLAARASAYCLRLLFGSKSSRSCCSVADISWKLIFLLYLSFTKRWPWTMASRA